MVPEQHEIEAFETVAAFRGWLATNHANRKVLWLRLYKKDSGVPTIGRDEAIDEALCWGWIDGQAAAGDERSWFQRFTQRKPRSVWSKINVAKVVRLVAEGRMQPAGLVHVEAAKADGRWAAAYHGSSSAELPADLMAAIEAEPEAARFFATVNKANRFAFYYRVTTAKRPETRAKRIVQFVAMLKRGETIY